MLRARSNGAGIAPEAEVLAQGVGLLIKEPGSTQMFEGVGEFWNTIRVLVGCFNEVGPLKSDGTRGTGIEELRLVGR